MVGQLGSLNVWVAEWSNGWMVGCLDGYMIGRLDGCWVASWMAGWFDSQINILQQESCMVGWLYSWMAGWLDGWMIGWFGVRWLDVGWKGVQDGQLVNLGGEGGVQSQDDDAGVGQNTADDDQVVQVGRRHFNLPEEQDDLVNLLYCTTRRVSY